MESSETWTVLKTCLSLSPSGVSMQILNDQLRRDSFVGLHFTFKNFQKYKTKNCVDKNLRNSRQIAKE